MEYCISHLFVQSWQTGRANHSAPTLVCNGIAFKLPLLQSEKQSPASPLQGIRSQVTCHTHVHRKSYMTVPRLFFNYFLCHQVVNSEYGDVMYVDTCITILATE